MDCSTRKESGQGRDKVPPCPCLSNELINVSRGGVSEGRKKS